MQKSLIALKPRKCIDLRTCTVSRLDKAFQVRRDIHLECHASLPKVASFCILLRPLAKISEETCVSTELA